MTSVKISPNIFTRKIGIALVSYLKDSSDAKYKNDILPGHSNQWESREIARVLVSMGYVTDVVDWDDSSFILSKKYDAIIDIADLFSRNKDILSDKTIKLLHLTGSYPSYQNQAEKKAAKRFERRTGVSYRLKRQVNNVKGAVESMQISDSISLLGNINTLATYPKKLRSKITLVPVTASYLKWIKQDHYVPTKRQFVWYFGSGAIHKGLDLVVETFLKRPNLVLHIIGNIEDDESFWSAYKGKIYHSKNIFYHGILDPNDEKFKKIIDNVFSFIAPSCSESMSTSVVTCLSIGLYPIISRDTGVDLPGNSGIYLKEVSIRAINEAISTLLGYTSGRILKEIKVIQKDAVNKYSREEFSKNIRIFLKKHLL